MASPLAHTLSGWCLFEAWRGRRGGAPAGTAAAVGAALFVTANLPDTDFIPLVLGLDPGQMLHQAGSHSVTFVIAAGLVAALLLRRRVPLRAGLALFCAAGLSHLVLDLLCKDTRAPIGIPLFWPFTWERWTSPVSLFFGVDRTSLAQVLSLRTAEVAAVELAWLLPPLLFLRWRNRVRARGAPARAGDEAGAAPVPLREPGSGW